MAIQLRRNRRATLFVAMCASAVVLAACQPLPVMTSDPAAPRTDGTYVDPVALLPDAGAPGLGTVNYPVPPSNVLFVAPGGSNAASGSQAAPLRTIQAAADRAVAGTTIVLRSGVYNESVRFQRGTVTVQPFGREVVWLDGSIGTTGWVKDGTAARWVVNFDDPLPSPTTFDPLAIDPAYPMAGDPHMVFINGSSLTQVASRGAVTSGRFFHDAANKRLYIGSDPASGEVRVTNLSTAMVVSVPNSAVRGIGIRRFGTMLSDQGAIRFTANKALVENVVIRQNAIAGLSIMGEDALVRKVTSYENGRLGIHAHNANRLVIDRSAVYRNNTERFAIGGAAGGIKTTYSNGVTVMATASYDNVGKGIWYDLSSADSRTVNSVSARNDVGIMVEMSMGGIVASNVVSDTLDGIRILETSRSEVYNNTLWNNQRGISFVDGLRGPVPLNSTIRNNAICANKDSTKPHVVVDDANRSRSAAQMGATLNNNAYYRSSAITTPFKMTWGNYPSGKIVSKTLATIQANTGQDLASFSAESATRCPFFGQYMANPFTVMGAALPTSVATALGATAGQPVRIGVLNLG